MVRFHFNRQGHLCPLIMVGWRKHWCQSIKQRAEHTELLNIEERLRNSRYLQVRILPQPRNGYEIPKIKKSQIGPLV